MNCSQFSSVLVKRPKLSYFYHYTGKEGLKAIADTGVIPQSSLSSADGLAYGYGVKLTTIDPSRDDDHIVKHNWDDRNPEELEMLINDPDVVKDTRSENWFVIAIPKADIITQVKSVDNRIGGLDVWLHPEKLVLDNMKGIVYWKRTRLVIAKPLTDQELKEWRNSWASNYCWEDKNIFKYEYI